MKVPEKRRPRYFATRVRFDSAEWKMARPDSPARRGAAAPESLSCRGGEEDTAPTVSRPRAGLRAAGSPEEERERDFLVLVGLPAVLKFRNARKPRDE
jgi:hypothetical protein